MCDFLDHKGQQPARYLPVSDLHLQCIRPWHGVWTSCTVIRLGTNSQRNSERLPKGESPVITWTSSFLAATDEGVL